MADWCESTSGEGNIIVRKYMEGSTNMEQAGLNKKMKRRDY
jgi:hypothetical protein